MTALAEKILAEIALFVDQDDLDTYGSGLAGCSMEHLIDTFGSNPRFFAALGFLAASKCIDVSRRHGVQTVVRGEIKRRPASILSPAQEMRRRWDNMQKRVRPIVLAINGPWCQVCGTEDALVIDHITPIAKGGTNDFDNLQPLCATCNGKKAAR